MLMAGEVTEIFQFSNEFSKVFIGKNGEFQMQLLFSTSQFHPRKVVYQM